MSYICPLKRGYMDSEGFDLGNLLSKSDAVLLLELIHESLSCEKEEQIKGLIERLEGLLSSERAVSVLARKLANGQIESFTALNINYTPGYVEAFVNGGFTEKDPVFIENFKNPRLQYWGDTLRQFPPTKDLFHLALDFGFTKMPQGCGYTHGARNLKGTEISLFSFYGVKKNKRAEAVIEVIVPHLHEALARIINLSRCLPVLSQKEIEVLKWLAQGKSGWDISRILGISENTVRFHIGNIKKKLDAVSSAHAVAIAVKYGVIDVE